VAPANDHARPQPIYTAVTRGQRRVCWLASVRRSRSLSETTTLGVDALTFDFDAFYRRLLARHGTRVGSLVRDAARALSH
jgi:hypothetical protein